MIYFEGFIQDDGFVLNDFYYKIENDTCFLLSKVGTIIVLSCSLFEQIINKNLSDQLKIKLINRGFASFPGSCDLCNDINLKPTFFLIDLTSKCNFNCIYCFREYNKKENNMRKEILLNICDFIYEYCKSNSIGKISIQPWGGEPLLAFDNIIIIDEYFKQKNLKYEISIETNCSLIDMKIAKELKERNISLGISLDGDDKLHNLQRPMMNRKNSYIAVKEGIKNLRNVGYEKLGTLCVITKNNFNCIPAIIKNLIYDLNIYNVKFNLMKPSPLTKNLALTKDEIVSFLNDLFETLDYYIQKDIVLVEGNIYQKVINLFLRKGNNICLSHGCQGGKSMISFDQNGDIYPCELTSYPEEKICSIYDDFNKNLESAIKSHDYFCTKEIEDCMKCPWRYYCCGGCTTAIKYLKGSVKGVDETECEVNKYIYSEIINRFLKDDKLINKYIEIAREGS